MNSSWNAKTITVRIILALLFFISTHYLITHTSLSSLSVAQMEVALDHEDRIDIYYSGNETFHPRQVVSSQKLSANSRHKFLFRFKDAVAKNIRIDLGRTPGIIRIYNLELHSYYGPPVRFDHRQIYNSFKPNDQIATFKLGDDHLLIETTSTDPWLIYTGSDIGRSNFLLSYLLPLLLTGGFLILIKAVDLSQLPAFTDIDTKKSSLGVNVAALDGIRGIAALVVLAEHCGVLPGLGMIGVWLFFSLSGFLLAVPFAKKPELAISGKYLTEYCLRRMKRILPMYYTLLVTTYLFGRNVPDFFRHLFFIQGEGYLWTIPQEVLFYIVLPFLMVVLYWLLMIGRWTALLFLLLLSWSADQYLTVQHFALYGYTNLIPFRLNVFVGGVVCAYAYTWLFQNPSFQALNKGRIQKYSSMAGLALLLFLFVFSARLVPGCGNFDAVHEVFIFSSLSSLFIFLVLLANNTLLSRIMGFLPFKAVGIVSFSFYLLHPKLIGFTNQVAIVFTGDNLSDIVKFFLSGILTYLCAVFAYSYIERPFLKSTPKPQPR